MRLICRVIGHRTIPVSPIGIVPRPGGILPSVDGMIAYKPDPDGGYEACTRCRKVLDKERESS